MPTRSTPRRHVRVPLRLRRAAGRPAVARPDGRGPWGADLVVLRGAPAQRIFSLHEVPAAPGGGGETRVEVRPELTEVPRSALGAVLARGRPKDAGEESSLGRALLLDRQAAGRLRETLVALKGAHTVRVLCRLANVAARATFEIGDVVFYCKDRRPEEGAEGPKLRSGPEKDSVAWMPVFDAGGRR